MVSLLVEGFVPVPTLSVMALKLTVPLEKLVPTILVLAPPQHDPLVSTVPTAAVLLSVPTLTVMALVTTSLPVAVCSLSNP